MPEATITAEDRKFAEAVGFMLAIASRCLSAARADLQRAKERDADDEVVAEIRMGVIAHAARHAALLDVVNEMPGIGAIIARAESAAIVRNDEVAS